ncbi:MAG: protein-glutamate O-methyltransferase CheR [Thermotogaceae bacterium]|nr:protein-glutamate O-methyltransferase CheR [Thermotogaceae bacterium]
MFSEKFQKNLKKLPLGSNLDFNFKSESTWKELPFEDFQWFLQEVKKKFNFDLTGYKPQRVKRRIEILIRKWGKSSYKEYLDLIVKNGKAQKEFLDRLTINVTEFFRNPEKWKELKTKYLPELLKESGSRFKAWSAGCSSGEEPYSLAILLEELRAPTTAKVIGTDIDVNVLEKARIGAYEERTLVNVSPNIKEKYFDYRDGLYYVKPNVKARVIFKRHNLLQDPFDKNYDLILCRNVVIYFEMKTKEELYRKFAESLKSGGIIFVGSTERIFNYRQIGLEVVAPFFYRKVK